MKQQDQPVTIQELLGRFEDYNFVPELVAELLKDAPLVIKDPDPIPDKVFDKTKRWTENSNVQLWIGHDRIPEMSMAVRDGDPDNSASGPRQSVKYPTYTQY